MTKPLKNKVALVAGGTRGAGRAIAVELGRAGGTVYVTGRTTRTHSSSLKRPETIEETAELVAQAGGNGIAVRCDHNVPEEVAELAARIRREQDGLDILVNNTPAGDAFIEWQPIWEHDLDKGLAALQLGLGSHMITLHHLLPLMLHRQNGLVCEITDGDDMFNARYRGSMFFDIVKVALARLGRVLHDELAPHGVASISLTPGYLRSEAMLDGRGVTEENWRDAVAADKWFAVSESPTYIARALVALVSDPNYKQWSGRSLSSGQVARHYGVTDIDGSQPDASGYFATAVFGDDSTVDVNDYR